MSMNRKANGWLALGFDGWQLAVESAMVINSRLAAFARGGPAADAEATRMVAEKIAAAQELGLKTMTGALGTTPYAVARASMTHLRGKVSANNKRLAKR
jgi:3-oxoacyl-ACP reductase-like protein